MKKLIENARKTGVMVVYLKDTYHCFEAGLSGDVGYHVG